MKKLAITASTALLLASSNFAMASGPDEGSSASSFPNPILDVIHAVTDVAETVNNDITRPLINTLVSDTTEVHKKIHNKVLHPTPSNPVSDTVHGAVHLVDTVTEPFLTGLSGLLTSGTRAIND